MTRHPRPHTRALARRRAGDRSGRALRSPAGTGPGERRRAAVKPLAEAKPLPPRAACPDASRGPAHTAAQDAPSRRPKWRPPLHSARGSGAGGAGARELDRVSSGQPSLGPHSSASPLGSASGPRSSVCGKPDLPPRAPGGRDCGLVSPRWFVGTGLASPTFPNLRASAAAAPNGSARG